MAVPQWTSNDVTEICIKALWSNGHPINNVVMVKRTQNDPQQSAQNVLKEWQEVVVAHFCNNYVLQGASFIDRDEANGVTGYIAADPAKTTVGSKVQSSLPPNCSQLARKVIAGRRGFRSGRFFLPPPQETDVDENGIIDAAIVLDVQVAMNLFRVNIGDRGGVGSSDDLLVVVHKVTPGTDSPSSVVTNIVVDPLIATMRRRIGR